MIVGEKVARPTKLALAADIARLLGLEVPSVSSGSSVDSTFLDRIHEAIGGGLSSAADSYRKTEAVLDQLGLTYDPYWDTSESAQDGGGTVTARAYSRIRTALSGVPRCFILSVNDAPVGTRWEDNHDEVYRYDSNVTGRMPLNDAGPESRIVYYATRKSKNAGMHFIATATVSYISPGWLGPWEARLKAYGTFPHPVDVSGFELPGWNRQHAITEISYGTCVALLSGGGLEPSHTDRVETAQGHDWSDNPVVDLGGFDVAKRVLSDFSSEDIAVELDIPTRLPLGTLAANPPFVATYSEESEDTLTATDPTALPSWSRNPQRDKLAERRAIDLTVKALTQSGWSFVGDRQRDGVGYDLEFRQDGQRLKVEVKGIQGPNLAFNITPKEFWRAKTDPEWVLVAVTSVLSPQKPTLSLITRDRVVAARQVITGYRVTL